MDVKPSTIGILISAERTSTGTSSGMDMSTKQKRLIIVAVIVAAIVLLLLLPVYHAHPDFAGTSIHRHFIWDYGHVH